MGLTQLDNNIFRAVKSNNTDLVKSLFAGNKDAQFALAKFNAEKQSLLSIAIQKGNIPLAEFLLNHPSNMCLFVLFPEDGKGYDDPFFMVQTRCNKGARLESLFSQIHSKMNGPRDECEIIYRSYVTAEQEKAPRVMKGYFFEDSPAASDPCFSYNTHSRAASEASAYATLPSYARGGGASGYGPGYGPMRGLDAASELLAHWLEAGGEGPVRVGWKLGDPIAPTTSGGGASGYGAGYGPMGRTDAASEKLARTLEDERIAAETAREMASLEAQAASAYDAIVAEWYAHNDGPMPDGWGVAAASSAAAVAAPDGRGVGVAATATAAAPLPVAARAPLPGGGASAGPLDIVSKIKSKPIGSWYKDFCDMAMTKCNMLASEEDNKTALYTAFCHLPMETIGGDTVLLGKLDGAWNAMYNLDE